MNRKELAESIADYVETSSKWNDWTKREVALATVLVLTDDIGAAQDYLKTIGVRIDLYTCQLTPDKGESNAE
jgi:hypothetical protein